MQDSKRFTIKIGGESGQGINSVGEILAKSLKNLGFNIFGYREYPSLIHGGVASYQLDFSNREVNSSSKHCQILLCISRRSIHEYLRSLTADGILIHSLTDVRFGKDEQEFIDNNRIKVVYINAEQEALLLGGRKLMANVIFLGVLWGLLKFEPTILEDVVIEKFAKKPEYVDINKKCLERGYRLEVEGVGPVSIGFYPNSSRKDSYVITGNEAASLGAYAAGVRAFYSYPMTPTSSVLTYLAEISHKTGMVVKQVEDEITAAQITLGSMYMGTRALTATSGGGFDLMTESVSLSGITEIPWVCLLGQRPGPATGLPTWTSAADLNLAIYSGHGEFPRCVVSLSDAQSAYLMIQHAFNIAEKYQIPVIVLTEKQIAEALYNIDSLPEPIEIVRGLLDPNGNQPKSSDRYRYAEDGISDRWLPGQFDATFNANSDEHTMDGSTTEDSEPTIAIIDKRMKKLKTIANSLPEPILFGKPDAETTIIGWGSSKGVLLDLLKVFEDEGESKRFNYLHYEYMFPFKGELLKQLETKGKKLALIENNYQAQLGKLVRQETGIEIDPKNTLLKYDGRPFFIEEVYNFIKRT